MDSIGAIVKLSMVTDDNYTYSGDHYTVYKNVKSFWCTPETNLILYVSKEKKRRGEM